MTRMKLFRYSGEPNRRVKSDYLSNYDGTKLGITGDELDGTIKSPYNVVHPTLILESDKGFPWNYLQLIIDDYEYDVATRFYFITKVTYLNNNLYEIECIEDVITTFGDIIKEYGYGQVERQEFTYRDSIPDNNRTFVLGQYTDNIIVRNAVILDKSDSRTGWWSLSGIGLGVAERDE